MSWVSRFLLLIGWKSRELSQNSKWRAAQRTFLKLRNKLTLKFPLPAVMWKHVVCPLQFFLTIAVATIKTLLMTFIYHRARNHWTLTRERSHCLSSFHGPSFISGSALFLACTLHSKENLQTPSVPWGNRLNVLRIYSQGRCLLCLSVPQWCVWGVSSNSIQDSISYRKFLPNQR